MELWIIVAALSAPMWALALLVSVQAVRETRAWRRASLCRPQLVWSRRIAEKRAAEQAARRKQK